MFLCIAFAGESIPFVLEDADIEDCLKAIELCKKDYYFNRQTAVVREDHVYLEAWPRKNLKMRRRLYICNDKVILETDTQCKDEVEETKRLLTYEQHCKLENIQCIEI